MADETPRKPVSAVEQWLARIAGEDETPRKPVSAVEQWLEIIYDKIDDIVPGGGAVSPTVETEQTATGARIIITDKNGVHVATLYNGADGYTPVRGTDYWTASDVAAMEAYCDDYIDTAIGVVLNGSY